MIYYLKYINEKKNTRKKKPKQSYEFLDGLKWVIFSKVHIKFIFE
jgi:hypothetical protein